MMVEVSGLLRCRHLITYMDYTNLQFSLFNVSKIKELVVDYQASRVDGWVKPLPDQHSLVYGGGGVWIQLTMSDLCPVETLQRKILCEDPPMSRTQTSEVTPADWQGQRLW